MLLSDKTLSVSEVDRRHVWHPFAQMQEYWSQPPLTITHGRGGWLWDTDGRRYLDGNASIWTNVHGHNDPDMTAALKRQLDAVAHSTMLGLTHEPGVRLAETLAGLVPGLNWTFFTDNGSGAVEVALKLSFQYWQLQGRPEKREVVGLSGAYHGDTFGTMAVGDSGFFHERFRPWAFKTHHIPAPVCEEHNGCVTRADMEESLQALRNLLEVRAGDIACMIMEPSVQGAAGMRLHPPGYLREVAGLCRRHGVHLILDEVFVAFGRLGKMIVCIEDGVTPDFLCLAKGLTGGYLPLAATLTRDEIFQEFLGTYGSGRAFFHGHTFTGNPLGAVAALETIRKLRPMIEDGILSHRASCFGRLIKEHFSGHPHIRSIRQRGLTAALDLCDAGQRDLPAARRVGLQVCLKARERGLILRPLGDSLLLVPPLCLEEDELRELAVRTLHSINDVLPNFT